MPTSNGSQAFYTDGDAWTCPDCGHIYRRQAGRRYPGRDRRNVRDTHKCPEVLPK